MSYSSTSTAQAIWSSSLVVKAALRQLETIIIPIPNEITKGVVVCRGWHASCRSLDSNVKPGESSLGSHADHADKASVSGAVTGQLESSVIENFAFLDATLLQGASDIKLKLSRNDAQVTDVAVTENRRVRVCTEQLRL